MRVALGLIHLGDTAADCGPGAVLDTRTDPPHCILSQYAYKLPVVAQNFPAAPGCNVVDLSRNACLLDDGTEAGCNAIQECDPLTGAVHYQYGLPGGPIAGQPGSLKTLGIDLTAVPTGFNFAMAPNRNLVNPTGPSTTFSAFIPTPAQIAANQPTALQIHAASNTPPVNATGGAAPPSGKTTSPDKPAGSGGTTDTSTSFDIAAFLQQQSIGSIPNWVLIAAGVGLAFYFGMKK